MSKFIWFNLIFMEVLYNTIFEFLKFQYLLLSSEIGKFPSEQLDFLVLQVEMCYK